MSFSEARRKLDDWVTKHGLHPSDPLNLCMVSRKELYTRRWNEDRTIQYRLSLLMPAFKLPSSLMEELQNTERFTAQSSRFACALFLIAQWKQEGIVPTGDEMVNRYPPYTKGGKDYTTFDIVEAMILSQIEARRKGAQQILRDAIDLLIRTIKGGTAKQFQKQHAKELQQLSEVVNLMNDDDPAGALQFIQNQKRKLQ